MCCIQEGQKFVGGLLVELDNGVIQGVLVLIQPAIDIVVHCTSIVNQGEVSLRRALFRLWLLKGLGLAKMLIMQLVLESCVRSLGEHALLFKDGENAHWLRKKKKNSHQSFNSGSKHIAHDTRNHFDY